jgi:hypothetical protein
MSRDAYELIEAGSPGELSNEVNARLLNPAWVLLGTSWSVTAPDGSCKYLQAVALKDAIVSEKV